jgi:type I restriction enzyme S subunit
MGQAPPGDSYNTEGDGLPLIAGAGDFQGERPVVSKYTTAPTKICTTGDIVLGIRASIGAKVLSDGEYCLGRGVAGLTPGRGLDPRFLWHWLSATAPALAAKGRGATFLQVSREDLGEMEIPLAPLDEQRRIAAILDQAEVLHAKRNQTLAHLDDLMRAVFLSMFGHPMSTTDAWPRVSLGSVVRIIRGASPRPAGDPRYFGGPIPWLKISDITAAPGRTVTSIKEGVTQAGRDRSVLLPPGTLVLTNSATVGVPKVVSAATCIHDGFLAFLDLSSQVEQTWLYAALLVSRERLVSLAPEGTQKNLNTPIVKGIEMSLPPTELQRSFAERLAAAETVAASVAASEHQASRLVAALQAAAFGGTL